FEMHNELFDNYSSWTNSNNPLRVFTELANKMGLDVKRFKTDFASESVNNTISADKKAGEDAGIDGTPTYFLNNKKLDNGDIATVEQFSAVIEKAIEKSK
nr:DsbA family protein [Candidatus Saccharibacteria bacterium]